MFTAEDEASIRNNMRDIYVAFLAGDSAALEELLADEFTFCDPSGKAVATKAQWLQDIASGELAFEEIDSGGAVEIDPSGDVARVRGNATLRTRYRRADYNGRFRYIGVYIRRNGRWQLSLTSAQRIG
jgi:ketosteroid isomerase-like protein